MVGKNSKEDVLFARASLLITQAVEAAKLLRAVGEPVAALSLHRRAEELDGIILDIKGVSVLKSLSGATAKA